MGVWEAAFWGFVGGFALLVGAGLGLIWRIPPRVVGIVMAFGAGVLISAVAFELVEVSFDASGALPVVAGLMAGSLTFYVGDLILDNRGAKHRKRSGGQQASGAAGAIVLGAMLDGYPRVGGHRSVAARWRGSRGRSGRRSVPVQCAGVPVRSHRTAQGRALAPAWIFHRGDGLVS